MTVVDSEQPPEAACVGARWGLSARSWRCCGGKKQEQSRKQERSKKETRAVAAAYRLQIVKESAERCLIQLHGARPPPADDPPAGVVDLDRVGACRENRGDIEMSGRTESGRAKGERGNIDLAH